VDENSRDVPESFTPEEREAVLIALDNIHGVFQHFKTTGLDGYDGLMKAALRGALFMLEEGIAKCQAPDGKRVLMFMLVEEFREDQRK